MRPGLLRVEAPCCVASGYEVDIQCSMAVFATEPRARSEAGPAPDAHPTTSGCTSAWDCPGLGPLLP